MKSFEEYLAESTFSDSRLVNLPGGNRNGAHKSFKPSQEKVYDVYLSVLTKHIEPYKARSLAYSLTNNGYSNIESVKKIVSSYVDDDLTNNIMMSIKSIHPSIKLLQR